MNIEITETEKLFHKERINTETSWTKNEEFDKNGFFLIKNLCNPEDFYHPVPNETGMVKYYGSLEKYDYFPEEVQVAGSFSRYSHPQYKKFHTEIRQRLEKEIGRKLSNTYYYDRFYFSGQELKKHLDRESCEISVTVHIGSNLEQCWPIWIKSPDVYWDEEKTTIKEFGKNSSFCLNPGDALVYKGCERPHWREKMPESIEKKSLLSLFKRNKQEKKYYHQIFFHYVLTDGIRCHFSNDCNPNL